ncbi:MAG TPA: DMT family transporter [Candidatus Aminicenantes bacterium]|nr:DMT family transporter [Candidatus Aminicenantes bacterium]
MRILTRLRDSGQMLLVVTVWGVNLTLVKLALRELAPMPYNVLRLPLASLVLLVWFGIAEGDWRVEHRHWGRILLLSISGYTIYQYLFISGIAGTTASNTAILFGTSPVLISLLSSFFKQERITWLGWTGIGLAFAGLYLVVAGRQGGFSLSASTWRGDLTVLTAVILWAHYSVSARPLLKVYSPLKFTTLTMSIGSLLFLPLGLPSLAKVDFPAVSWLTWGLLAFSGIMALSVTLILWFDSVRRVGNSQTAVYSNLQPAIAVVFAHFVLGEALTLSLLGGAAIILLGIVLTRRGRQPG